MLPADTNPCFVVLANLSAVAEQAARYAAVLGMPQQARLELLHLYHDPVLDPELVTVTAAHTFRTQAETAALLRQQAQQLAVPAEVKISVQPLATAVQEGVCQGHPQLLVMGLSAEHTLLDHFLRNQALPVLRATQRPLLLVPAGTAPLPRLPRRVALAVDAEPFRLNEAAEALEPLLASWQAAYTVVHVLVPGEREAYPGQRALSHLRLSGLLPAAQPLELYEEAHVRPAAGVLQAIADTQADLLVLITRPRSFLGRIFHESVTAGVLRHCPVPVLLLPARARAQDQDQPSWMPGMT